MRCAESRRYLVNWCPPVKCKNKYHDHLVVSINYLNGQLDVHSPRLGF